MKNAIKEYLNSTINLARSLIIKTEVSAKLMNDYIKMYYGSNYLSDDPYTWKYYLNISGKYHPTDTLMYITSLDTKEEILFDKNILLDHPTTRSIYKLGSVFLDNLIETYPKQQLLIYGIIYPVDINVAINAKDYTILTYDPSYIEPQEYSLIRKLNEWIYNYQYRWNLKAYELTDKLYPVVQTTQLYLHIVTKILNIRLSNCKTSEVHSFHMKNYLDSHYGIAKHIDNIPIKTLMWLYRNIRYYSKLIGHTNTVNEFIKYLLIDNGISAGYINIEQIEDKSSNGLPSINFKYVPVANSPINTTQMDLDINVIYDKETSDIYNGGIYGVDYITPNISNDEHNIEKMNYNKLDTKILDLRIYDLGDISPIQKIDVFSNNWIYNVLNNKYFLDIEFVDDNQVTHNLNQYESVIMYLYLLSKYLKITDPVIPNWVVKNIPKTNVNVFDLVAATTNDSNLDLLISDTITRLPNDNNYTDLKGFNNYLNSLYEYTLRQWIILSNVDDTYSHGQLKSIYEYLYFTDKISISDQGTLFEDWLTSNNINISINDNYDIVSSIKELLFVCTGYKIKDVSEIKKLINSSIEILRSVTAYTTQIVSTIKDPSDININKSSLRVTDGRFKVINLPKVTFNCLINYTPVIDNFYCNTEIKPHLQMTCDDIYKPTVTMDCSLDRYHPNLEIDCSLENFKPTIGLDCSIEKYRPTGVIVCSLYNYKPTIAIDCR